ncbi:helix-turn-helix transcriptional regulator [Streptomyces puniciscabiei]|uniref:helix-turn-helix transcriptional regulator n=1 Tax=Streptomyces puniciscabiei TaxID=164348 RepID=UPI00332645E5
MAEADGSRVTLAAQHQALLEALAGSRPVPAGRLLGLPELDADDVWVDTAGAAALVRVNPKTITGWLARGGPKKRPFPSPHRLLYRLYWQRSEIEEWLCGGSSERRS